MSAYTVLSVHPNWLSQISASSMFTVLNGASSKLDACHSILSAERQWHTNGHITVAVLVAMKNKTLGTR